MHRRPILTALAASALALTGALATSTPASASPAIPATTYSYGSCTIQLTYGKAIASYSSRASFFGTTTHVSLSTTGDGYRLVWNRLHVPGSHVARGITGTVITSRGWDARSGYSPTVWLSVGVVDVNSGRYGWCRT